MDAFRITCGELGIDSRPWFAPETDLLDVPELTEEDLLYRSYTRPEGKLLERMLINDRCSHFYQYWQTGVHDMASSDFFCAKRHLPVIPSTPCLPTDRSTLSQLAERLHGFPLVVKVLGSSHGVGVVRIDSYESLCSLADYLATLSVQVVVKQYIPHTYSARFNVVGKRVIESNVNYARDGEFRSNSGTGERRQEVRDFPEEVQQIAVDAVHAYGVEMGGVDIIFDVEERPYITEVNFPCNFIMSQKLSGIDIARAMVQHLAAKAQTKTSGVDEASV
ncbi:hypothetical protein GVX82_04890 [Patescibacteria group bacterium]|nr:hypothetical protein [Patescibacteria group bacterium]